MDFDFCPGCGQPSGFITLGASWYRCLTCERTVLIVERPAQVPADVPLYVGVCHEQPNGKMAYIPVSKPGDKGVTL